MSTTIYLTIIYIYNIRYFNDSYISLLLGVIIARALSTAWPATLEAWQATRAMRKPDTAGHNNMDTTCLESALDRVTVMPSFLNSTSSTGMSLMVHFSSGGGMASTLQVMFMTSPSVRFKLGDELCMLSSGRSDMVMII